MNTDHPDDDAAVERREPSIFDVARAAGVSAQTVSRVSTGTGPVRVETRRKVVDVMRRIGYRPNLAARALKAGKFHSIGLVVFSLTSFGSRSTVEAIADQAAEAGYAVALASIRVSDADDVEGAFARLRAKGVDGAIIVMESRQIDRAVLSAEWGFPIVVLDSSDQYDRPVVDHDQEQGARLATAHLLSLGHRTVWHVSGPTSSQSASRRRAAWEATLVAHAAPVPAPVIGDWSSKSGLAAGKTLLIEPDVTAVFCANDEMALGVMQAFHCVGRRIPADVSVVGFDATPESEWYWPPLTTVRQDFAQLGADALAQLVAVIEGREPTSSPRTPVELVVRGSTSRPPSP